MMGTAHEQGCDQSGTVIGFPRAVTDAVKDETVASIVDVLQEQLYFAREGKLRSVAVVSVSADGRPSPTQRSCNHGRCSKPDRQADCAGSRHYGGAPVSSLASVSTNRGLLLRRLRGNVRSHQTATKIAPSGGSLLCGRLSF